MTIATNTPASTGGSGAGVAMMAFSMASSAFAGIQRNKNLAAQYKQMEKQHEMNMSATRIALNSLDMRVGRQASQIERDRVRAQAQISQQAYTAEGTARVQAAQLGITGKRADLYKTQDIERTEARLLENIDETAEIEQENLKNNLLDSANRMIVNLNNQIPNVPTQNKWDTVLSTTQTALSTYASMDKTDKAQFKHDISGFFNFSD